MDDTADSRGFPPTVATPGPSVPSRQEVACVPVGPSAPPDTISLLNALRRRWRLAAILSVSLASLTVFAVYTAMPPAKFKARSMLQVSALPPRVIVDTNELRADFRTYQKTQEAYIRSRIVLKAALEKPGLKDLKLVRMQSDPLDWLEKQILIDFSNGSEILQIGMSGDDPKALAMLVNAITQSYLEEVVGAETSQRRERHNMLKITWDKYQDKLRDKREQVKRLTKITGSSSPQAIAVVHQAEQLRLARVEDELARTQLELNAVEMEAALLEKQINLTGDLVNVAADEAQVARDPVVVSLGARVAKAQTDLRKISRLTRYLSDVSYQRCRHELRAARDALQECAERLRPVITSQLSEGANATSRIKLELAMERIKILTKLQEELSDGVKRAWSRAEVLTRTSVDLDSIQDEIYAAEQIATKIGVEIEVLNVELQAPPRVKLIQMADAPRGTDNKRILKVAGGAGLGVFVLGLAGVSFWEFRSRRIDSVNEVSTKLGIRVIGSLPALPYRRKRRSGQAETEERHWKTQMIESIDAARTSLLYASRSGSLRVVMVTSAEGEEGKLSLSYHLASSLARAGRKTLLIDFDLRCPSLHTICAQPDDPGVSEILRGESSVSGVTRVVDTPGLYLIPAGRPDGAALIALAREDLRLLFEELRVGYEFVIVHSAPILPVADALLVGQYVDGVILSVTREVSRGPQVYAASERLAALRIPLLGAIVTGTKLTTSSPGFLPRLPERHRHRVTHPE